MEETPSHAFSIRFILKGIEYSASLTMNQKGDHDEYHVISKNEGLAKVYGSQTIDNYYNQKNPLRSRHPDSEYSKALIEGIQEFLDSKHC